jgi:hypothetical protein
MTTTSLKPNKNKHEERVPTPPATDEMGKQEKEGDQEGGTRKPYFGGWEGRRLCRLMHV